MKSRSPAESLGRARAGLADPARFDGIGARELAKSFGEPPTFALRHASFDIRRGEFVAIVGRSGSGKSTLLYCLSGLDRPTQGEVWIDGKAISTLRAAEFERLRNERIGFVFQFHYLLPELSLLENVLMPARKYGREKSKATYARELLRDFGLERIQHRKPGQVSGGESQRAAVARALIMSPGYVFADEPTGNLDSANGDRVMEIFRRVNSDYGATIIMVTHDPDFADMASRKIFIKDGVAGGDEAAAAPPAH